MAQDEIHEGKRHSRFWLYAPLALLVLVAVAWSAAWFQIRNRAGVEIERWLAKEAQAGRQWVCPNREIGGFPFRIEVTCPALTLRQKDGVQVSLGRVESVAQVYQPRLVITEMEGPLRLTDGTVTVEGGWDLLQTSVHGAPDGIQRISIVADNPSFTVRGAAAEDVAVSSGHLEVHLRPTPARSQEGAYDAAIDARQARVPALDALFGGGEPANLQMDVTATQAKGFSGRPVIEEIERWRAAGGRLDILQFSLTKGGNRIEAKGDLKLDEVHRPAGQLQIAAAGLDRLVGALTGGRVGGNLLGALLGQAPRPQTQEPAAAAAQPSLSSLPPLRLENGRLLLGPFTVPSLRLPALY
jgi:hypothetical protein